MFDGFFGEDRRCFEPCFGSFLFEDDRCCFEPNFCFSLFRDDRRCFELNFGFSIFEKIENAFVRSFLQGRCLRSDVLDMPFYCELALESSLTLCGDGKECGDQVDEVCYNWFGGPERYFDNASYNRVNDHSNNDLMSFFNDHSNTSNAFLNIINDFSDNGSYDRVNGFSDCDSGCGRDLVFDGSNIEHEKMCHDMYKIGDRCGRNYGAESISGDRLSERGGIMVVGLPWNEDFVISDLRSLGMAWAVNGVFGGNSSADVKDRSSPSLFLNLYKESDLLLTERGYDASLSCEGCFYGNEVGFNEIHFAFSGACRFGDDPGRGRNVFVGKDGGRVFDLGSEVEGSFADRRCHCEHEFCFYEYDRKHKAEVCFADRGCRNAEFPLFEFDCGLEVSDMMCEGRLFADVDLLLNGWAERLERQGLRLLNDNSELGKIGLPRAGRAELSQKIVGALQDRFDFMHKGADVFQDKGTWVSGFGISGISAEIRKTEMLFAGNVKVWFEKLAGAVESYGEDLIPNAEWERFGMVKGVLPLREEESVISPEEVKKIRKAIVTEYYREPVKAEIRVDMSGMKNIINKEMNIDSIVTDLTAAVSEAVASAAEGVHGL